MIRIKYYKNPLDKTSFVALSIEAKSILCVDLKRKLKQELPEDDFVVIRRRKVLLDNSIINDGDNLQVIFYVKDAVFWVTVYASFVAIATYAYYAAVIYSLYMAFKYATASKPSYDTIGSDLAEGSRTYSWSGIMTTADVGIPIPVVYGEHKVGGNIINAYINSDGDKNYLNILLSLCEGEIDSISSITINDQPAANYDGITVYSDRLGTNTDTVIPNFQNLYDNYSIGQNLNSLGDNYIYTTLGSLVEGFEVQLSFPSGIFQMNTGNGQVESWTVGIRIEYKLHSAGSWTTFTDTTISATQRTDIKRYFRKEGLAAGQYDIRVTRTTEASGYYATGECQLSYVVEIRTDDLAYPNVAKLGVKAMATNQLNGTTPNISCVVKGRKVEVPLIMCGGVKVAWLDYYWDPVAEEFRRFSDDASCSWDGVSWVNRWSANPVWCLRDLLTNTRYGLGSHIDTSVIDRDEWLALAQYCDEKVSDGIGGYEKRFRLDIVLDSQNRAIDSLQQIVQSFRGLLYYAGSSFGLAIDKPASPGFLFGEQDIIKGSMSQAFRPLKERNNIIEAQFLDKDQGYKQQVLSIIDEAAIDSGEPIRKQSIRIYTTRSTQALREARFQLLQQKYLVRSISFKAGINAIRCQPGDVISVSNDFTQWGFSGRVADGSTTSVINLDREVVIESGKTYRLMVRFSDDTLEERTITTVPGTYSSVEVSAAYSSAPLEYDGFAFGELDKVKKDFRVVNMRRASDLECEIQAIEYNAAIYNTDSITIPTINSSALSLEVPDVASLKLTERMAKLSDGTIENCIDVWWRRPDANSYYVLYKKARVWISDDNGLSWRIAGETEGDHLAIMGGLIDGTVYKVAVTTVAIDGRETTLANCPYATITLTGKSGLPSDVAYFVAVQSREEVYYYWSAISDIDLAGYEIRQGDGWEVGDIIDTYLQGISHRKPIKKTGTMHFWIKGIDTSGNYSENATEAILVVDNIPFQNIISEYEEHPAWTGTKTNTVQVGNNLGISDGELSGTYVTDVRDIGYVANVRIAVETVVVDNSTSLKWSDLGNIQWSSLPRSMRWSGNDVIGATSLRIRISDDNITWSDWAEYVPGDFRCRYYQLELTLTRSDTSKNIQCTDFSHYVDLPDVDDKITDSVADSAAGKDVVFVKEFHQVYGVHVTITSGAGVYHRISGLDTTGCNVKLYDLTGTETTGDFLAHIHGI